jgi:hypothetical protein
MIHINIVALLLFLHFMMDFFFQSHYISTHKSKSMLVCLLHALWYTTVFAWFGLVFYLVTLFTHFVIDAVTSRITSRLYPNHIHWFFVVIGFDQMLHVFLLMWLYVITQGLP